MKELAYTTGETAAICRCAPRTVTKWCEKGKLTYWRLPGSRDRRIAHSDLVTFMRGNDFPEHMIPEPKPSLVVPEIVSGDQTPKAGDLAAPKKIAANSALSVILMTPKPDAEATRALYKALAASERQVALHECGDWFSCGQTIGRQKPNVVVVIVDEWSNPSLKSLLRSSFDASDKFRDFACVAVAPASSTTRQAHAQVGTQKWHAVFTRPLLLDMLALWVRSVVSDDNRLRIPEPAMYPPLETTDG